MIITAPTGQYESVLPQSPSDSTSVVYTVSNSDPPRSAVKFLKLPDGIKSKLKSARTYGSERRLVLGDLISVMKMVGTVKADNGDELYSIGQVLEFVDTEQSDVEDNLVGDIVETRHNLHYIDALKLGLTSSEVEALNSAAEESQRIYLDEMAVLQATRKELESDMNDVKKQINDADKLIAGIDTVLAAVKNDELTAVKAKMLSKVTELRSELDNIIIEYNEIPQKLSNIRDKLTSLTELVK